jgi:hypothetical protein
VLLAPAGAEAQTGGVTMKTMVSETVALSVLPNSISGDVVSTGNTVRITVSDADANAPIIRVPLLVRSNSSFKISVAVESNTAEVTQLSVTDARATGTLVSPQAITELNVPRQFDVRGDENTSSVLNLLDVSRPVLVASGPRVSRGGTLVSPNNALQITLLIRLQPRPARDWLAHLTFVATAGLPSQ